MKSGKDVKTKSEVAICTCGCGLPILMAVPRFLPGHDSRVHSMAKRIETGELKVKDVPKVALDYLRAKGMVGAKPRGNARAAAA